MFLALGLHLFYRKRSNTYKDKDEGCGMDIPPNTMESDLAMTLVQDSTAIFADDGLWRTPQRRSNRQAPQLASANIKSMYGVDEGGCKPRGPQAPKRQAVGSPKTGDLNTCYPGYSPIILSKSEADDEMQDPWDDVQPSLHSPITLTDDDCDKEQDPSLSPCTARLERISLGADSDACGSIEAKKKEAPVKRTVKRARRTRKERVIGRIYRWVENCFHTKEVLNPCAGLKKHTTANICDSLLNARTGSCVWSKSVEGRIPQSEGAISSDKLAYLETKPSLHAQVLMSDCGSDISVGSRKDNLLDSNRCAYPCLNIAVPAAIKNCAIGKFLGKLYSQSSVKAEQEIILCNWLMGQNDEGAPPEVVDWARRRLCGQSSSATSGHAFSKAGLIISKKRQRFMADNVDDISFLGWHYKDNGWGESSKRSRCVPQVEGESLEEEIQMAA